MSRHALAISLFVAGAIALGAQSKETGKEMNKELERLQHCGVVMEEILNVPDNIPQEVLEKSECVVVIPSMTKVALGLGGEYGRGAMVCRGGPRFNGPWGAPALYTIEGASIGFQIGGSSTDLVLMITNPRGVDALLDSKVKIGGEMSAAAGPKGRHVEASTDASMHAELLSYSRSRGAFAGVSLDGSSLRPDNEATSIVYGRPLTAREVVAGAGVHAPAAGRHLTDVLQLRAPYNDSKKEPR
jgi:lipid-binding SYLF domain-containing protein